MMTRKTHTSKTYVLLFLLVLFGSVGNTILSKGMKDVGDLDISRFSALESGAVRVLSSGTIWMGIALMLMFMVCHMLVLSWADYSFVMPFSAIAYALVPLLGYLFLHEQVSAARWIGILLIFLGVLLINRTPPRTTSLQPPLERPTEMRTAFILIFVVVTGTGGEICLTHAMKLLGEVHDFRPRAIAAFVLGALRVGWLWIAVLLMTASFFCVPGDAVVVPGQLCYSGDVARLCGWRVRGENLPRRTTQCDALGGNCPDLFWSGDGLGRRSACHFSFSSGDPGAPLDDSGAGAWPAVLLSAGNLFRMEIFPRGAQSCEP